MATIRTGFTRPIVNVLPNFLTVHQMVGQATGKNVTVTRTLTDRTINPGVKLTISRTIGEAGKLELPFHGKKISVSIKANDMATDIAEKLEAALEKAGKGLVDVSLSRALAVGMKGSRIDVTISPAATKPLTQADRDAAVKLRPAVREHYVKVKMGTALPANQHPTTTEFGRVRRAPNGDLLMRITAPLGKGNDYRFAWVNLKTNQFYDMAIKGKKTTFHGPMPLPASAAFKRKDFTAEQLDGLSVTAELAHRPRIPPKATGPDAA